MRLKSILICFFIGCGLALSAQSITVTSFRALPNDMTAASDLEGKRIDQNGEVAALIKVVTPETGFVFEGGTLGIVDTKQKVGEIWVWVPKNSRKITILHNQLGVLRDYRYPIEIEAERTYELKLETEKAENPQKEETTQHYLTFQISPANATLLVNDETWKVDADGMAVRFVNCGTYNYLVMAPNYSIETGAVVLDGSDDMKKVKVSLKPNLVDTAKNTNTQKRSDSSGKNTINDNKNISNAIKYLEALSFSYSINSLKSGAVISGGVGSINQGKHVGWYADYKCHILSTDMSSSDAVLSVELGGGMLMRLNKGTSRNKFLLQVGLDCGYSVFDYYGAKGICEMLNSRVEYMHDGNGLGVFTEAFLGKFGSLTCYGINFGLSWTFVRNNWKDLNHF